MKLERITLFNFRQYHGRQRLAFSKDPQRNVTVIHGINGAGKTSMFLALNWCLYGKSVENFTVIDNVGELVSKEIISQTVPGELVSMWVEVSFLHNGGRYMVKRSIQGVKQPEGTVSMRELDEFTMMQIRADGQAKRVHNPIGMMNSILPVNVREYFLFDGEKIDNFAKPEAASQVKDAIYLVLKLEILDRARRHFDSMAADYRRELKKASGGELGNLIDKYEAVLGKKKKVEIRLGEIEEEIGSAKTKIAEINRKLKDSQNAKTLQEKRERIEGELGQRRTELEEKIETIRDAATGAYLIRAQSAVKGALRVLDEKRERGEIPSSIRQQFVQDLLDDMHCICGRSFTDGSPEQQRLNHLLTSSFPSKLEDDVLDTSATLRTFDVRIADHLGNLNYEMGQRTRLVDIVKGLEAERDDIGRQLKGSPLEEISQLEKRRQDYEADIDSYNMEMGSLKTLIENQTKEIEGLQKTIKKAQKEEKKGQLLGTKLDLAQRAADAIREIYQTFANDMRLKIEAKTKEIFKELVWKNSHFQDVRLGSDYHLEVIDRYGMSARPELSAGERQVLSLSFITAMSRVSEEEAPLVMDTPFGRLSSHHRNSITRYIPALAAQLVLFVTDEELRDEARRNLESRIGAEYRLEFDRHTSCTEIVEVAP